MSFGVSGPRLSFGSATMLKRTAEAHITEWKEKEERDGKREKERERKEEQTSV